jgi:hypothetical protein
LSVRRLQATEELLRGVEEKNSSSPIVTRDCVYTYDLESFNALQRQLSRCVEALTRADQYDQSMLLRAISMFEAMILKLLQRMNSNKDISWKSELGDRRQPL